jgi:glycosyltransferase XagB
MPRYCHNVRNYRFNEYMLTGDYFTSGSSGKPDAPETRQQYSAPPISAAHEDAPEVSFFIKLGIGKPAVAQAAKDARANGSTIEQELIASRAIKAEYYYEAFARDLGLPFMFDLDPAQVQLTSSIDSQLIEGPIVRINRKNEPPLLVFSPLATQRDQLIGVLEGSEELLRSIAVASPATIRKAIWEAGQERRIRLSANLLFDAAPQFSARIVFSGFQGFLCGILIAILPLLFWQFPDQSLLLLHVLLSLFYLGAISLRGIALIAADNQSAPRAAACTLPGALPVYTVLVAIYRETAMVDQLVGALERIDWPKSRLDIKLICEADDLETLEAVRRRIRHSCFEIVEVPHGGPRTKPNALTYALAAARGEFLVIYDAEDRPHPSQLKEAYKQFRGAPAELACLQAPLDISNAQGSWIAANFALEYAALFRIILPLLASMKLPMPLGGTSNHFRTAILKECGGWDPFNVTEDADLGMRLKRLGYHCGVLTLATLEDAPTLWSVWHAQRSRWFKGWLQTLLVHFRNPAALHADIGLHGFLSVFMTTGGMLFSALVHPLILLFLGQTVWLICVLGLHSASDWQLLLLVADLINIAGSYALFVLLGQRGLRAQDMRTLGKHWLCVPIYWIMLSLAAWKAVYEIRKNPFLWRKTPHQPKQTNDLAVKRHRRRRQEAGS